MLSRGSLSKILANQNEPDIAPVLQVYDVKGVGAEPNRPNRFKCTVTDGMLSAPGMFSQQLNELLYTERVKNFTVVRINKFMVQNLNSQQLLIVVDAEVIQQLDHLIQEHGASSSTTNQSYGQSTHMNPSNVPSYGAPPTAHSNVPSYGAPSTTVPSYGQTTPSIPSYGSTNIPSYGAPAPSYGGISATSGYGAPTPSYGSTASTNSTVPSYGAPPATTITPNYGAPAVTGYGSNTYGNYGSKAIVKDDSNIQITPISIINPYSNKWTIKARVTRKSDIKRWSNAKGEGTLFSIDLLDNAGTEIRATFFKEACNKFFPLIEESKVYTFSAGKLKVVTNSQYSNIKNPYELTFDQNSEIRPAMEDDSIKRTTYNFVKISNIANMDTGAILDVIGIVRQAGEYNEITSTKLGGKVLQKRDLYIYDDSNTEIRCTVWGEKAQDSTIEWTNSIVALKGVKIGDYQGKNLGTIGSTVISVKPDIPEGYALYQWMKDTNATGTNLISLSGTNAVDTRGVDPIDKRKLLSHIREPGVGQGEKGDYFSVKATINYIRHEQDPWYTACPTTGCNKKVIDIGNGYYRCEKCNNSYTECDYRYIMSLTVADNSGQQWMSVFNEMAEKMIGKTAKEIHELKMEGREDEVNRIYNDALFKTYHMRTRAKMEAVNDEQRLKCTILKLDPIDWKQESLQLLDAIHKYQ